MGITLQTRSAAGGRGGGTHSLSWCRRPRFHPLFTAVLRELVLLQQSGGVCARSVECSHRQAWPSHHVNLWDLGQWPGWMEVRKPL